MAVRIVSLTAKIGLDGTGFQQGLSKAGQQFRSFAGNIKTQLAGAFSVIAIGAFLKDVIRLGGEIDDMSKKLRISTTDFQALQFALKQSGADASDLQSAFKFLAKAREEALGGNFEKMAAFGDLGVGRAALEAGNLVEILKTIGDTIRSVDFGAGESPLLEKVLGRGAMELIPVFKNGLREAAAEAERIGAIMGPEVVDQLDKAGDAADRLATKFKVAVAPAVGFFLDKLYMAMEGWRALGAFLGGGVGAARESVAEAERFRAGAKGAPESTRGKAEPTHVPTQKQLDELGKRFGGKANLLADGTIAFSGGPVGGGARKDTGQQFGFSSAQDILKENKDLKEIAKHSARDVKVLEEILAEIRRRNTGNSGPFGSQ